MGIQLTTELDAINSLLATIGEAPLNSMEGVSGVVDAVIAKKTITETSLQVQEEGWHWNTEEGVILQPDVNGYISVARNCIECTSMGDEQIILRGTRVYDRKNHTFVFSKSLKVKLKMALEFDEIPQAARHYISVRASRTFQSRVLGSQAIEGFTQDDEIRARTALMNYEAGTASHNILTGSAFAQNILYRGR